MPIEWCKNHVPFGHRVSSYVSMIYMPLSDVCLMLIPSAFSMKNTGKNVYRLNEHTLTLDLLVILCLLHLSDIDSKKSKYTAKGYNLIR